MDWSRQSGDIACKAALAAHTALQASEIEAFTTQCRTIVQEGQAQNQPAPKKPGHRGRAKQSGAFNLLRRLHEREQEVLRFMHD
ncbi:MAG TPA: IS66 family transposase, partial [Polaromonas sp.]|nr:IS66 family transposase [Polaromonas sp.]